MTPDTQAIDFNAIFTTLDLELSQTFATFPGDAEYAGEAPTWRNYYATQWAAQRTEATAVMSSFLKAQPGIKANFHGLWAYAEKDGKRNPVMELPMKQIP